LIAADIDGDGNTDLITGKRFWSHGKIEAGSDKPARLYWFKAARDLEDKTNPVEYLRAIALLFNTRAVARSGGT
jgi:hypothetical protein